MNQSIKQLAKDIALRYNGKSRIETAIEPLNFFYFSESTEMMATLYEPSLCIIVQGEKTVDIGDEIFKYNPSRYLLASIHTPAQVCITEASKESPYVGLTITFSMEQIFEVLKELEDTDQNPASKQRLYFGDMEPRLINPISRLVKLLDTPDDIKVLAPLIIKEILYMVMRGEGGSFIRQYIMDSSSAQMVVKAITQIKANFANTLNIKKLAETIGMSESSLYTNFKRITSMSPLQFQKSLRLQEARRILLTKNIEASEVAFSVGYESPSQFSREYSRMFGLPPKTDVKVSRGL